MNDLIQMGFDYTALPVDVSSSLQLRADRFVAVRNRAIYEMGKELYEAQQELAQHKIGCFQAWVESLGVSYQTGYDLISVYQNAGSDIIKLFDNKKLNQTVTVMLSRPSTPDSVKQKAIEKAESGEKVTVADVKDWKAELETERQARLTAEQRSKEWNEQYIKERDEKRAAEQKVLTLESQPKPEPEVIEKEVVPADYESAKQQAATLQAQTETLQKQLATLQKQQDKIINDQVKTKLQGYQDELNKLESDKQVIEDIVARKKAYLDSLSSEVKRIETHQDVINGVRLELIGLAAFLNDMEPMNDPATIRKWLALADMHQEAVNAIRMVFGKPSLELAA